MASSLTVPVTPEQLARPVRAPESLSPMGSELSFITLMPGGDYDVWMYSFSTKQKTPFVVVRYRRSTAATFPRTANGWPMFRLKRDDLKCGFDHFRQALQPFR